MPILIGLIISFIGKVLIAMFAVKILVFAAVALLTTAFTAEMVGLAQSMVEPVLTPEILSGLKILPVNTATYLSIMISAAMAKWIFVSSVKSLSIFR